MKLLVCDDHAILREGLRAMLEGPQTAVLEAASADEALRVLAAHREIDLVLLDLVMPGGDGWSALRQMRIDHPRVPVVIVSASEDPHDIRAALADGASGFIPKSSSAAVFCSALQLVLDGGMYLPPELLRDSPASGAAPIGASALAREWRRRRQGAAIPLTARQKQIVAAMVRGLTNAQIGAALRIAEGTVKTHLSAVFQALGVSNRTEAALALRGLDLEG